LGATAVGYFDDRFGCEPSLPIARDEGRRRRSDQNTVAGEIADTPGVHGFVAVPEVQRGFSSNGKESKSSVVDLTTLKTTSKIDTGQILTQLFTSHVMVRSTFSITLEIRSRYQCESRYRLSDDSARRKSRIRGGR
jgi:hypothetical protein